jgi:hypothetical protein
MGIVFAARRTWVEPDELWMIMQDDEYKRVVSIDDVGRGDVVVYKNDEGDVVHVGLVAEIRITLEISTREVFVLSQWGADGEYFHCIDDLHPNLGTPTEYWTDRR